MANIAAPTSYAAAPFSGLADAIVHHIEKFAERRGHRAEIARLSRMTDVELDGLGLTRATIANRVFGGIYYL